MGRPAQTHAEELMRAFANAASAVRLYPPTSLLPAQAVDRFRALAAEATADTPLQVAVEPAGFTFAECALAEGQATVAAFAEALYAHQVGKLIIAPGVTAEETLAFLRCVAGDPHVAKDAGGLRAVLKRAGVTRIAVIEVTLRASTEEGLAGLDLTAAPLEEIAPRVAAAAFAWQDSAPLGPGVDGLGDAIDALEEAARDLAVQRVAEALMRLPEETRVKALAAACSTDTQGRPMRSMLDVIGRMKPAALARLLTLAAGMVGMPASEMLRELSLPPAALSAVMMLLAPSAQSERARGVPENADAAGMAAEASVEDETEAADLERQIAHSSRAEAAAKALHTTVELATRSRSEDAVRAIGDALAPAVRSGAFSEVRGALRYLGSLADVPSLASASNAARLALADPELVRVCIASLTEGADADVVASIVSAAGPVGADTFIAAYLAADDAARSRLQHVLRSMGDAVVSAAGRGLRDADAAQAKELIAVLTGVGDKRMVPVLRLALEHLDFGVREACLEALGQVGGAEAERMLVGALNHWDPETRRAAAREIGKARAASAVPAMLRILQGYYLFERNYGLKKDLIESLEVLGSPAALPTLRRMAGRRFVVGRKNRELRYLARRAVAGLEVNGRTTEGRAS
jgi:hypothetical protein